MLIRQVKYLKKYFYKISSSIYLSVLPTTKMIEDIIYDMNLLIDNNSKISISPDYIKNSKGYLIKIGKIIVPTHKNQKGSLLYRTFYKYYFIINELKKIQNSITINI